MAGLHITSLFTQQSPNLRGGNPAPFLLRSEMLVGTTFVKGDEKAYAYQEVHLQSPNSKGIRRYRIIFVNRDGKMAEYREDMGSSKKYKGVRQLNIPSLWEHSVDELLDIADYLRTETHIDLKDWLEIENYKT